MTPTPMRLRFALTAVLALATMVPAEAQRPGGGAEAGDSVGRTPNPLAGLRFRELGPATTSGRVSDIAIHPADKSTWYLGTGSGGVWKTTNAGTTWSPIFDSQASYAIGDVSIAPSDPLTVWVGTGENSSQRALGYGDGVYRSTDAGRTWKNMGLRQSAHIGGIAIHPKDANTVLVAAQGPLWTGGGERGVYRTTDGGATWELVLKGDNEWTGANEVHLDPKNPTVVYAVMWQRFRRQWGFINGGPGSSIHKSIDGGTTWTRLSAGLPNEEMGKIGLAVSPADPNTIYAVIEASARSRGLYRSTDAGSSWRKMSSYNAGPPFYYHELFPDPNEVGRLYSVDVGLMVSADSGNSFSGLPTRTKHVDHHALWINPDNTSHMITGNDGGLYQSFDRGATWQYHANLPLTQFYKLAIDNSKPFYYVYGGTQDNNTLGGPSRTTASRGILNDDWFVVTGGDGFQPAIDPEEPNIVYGESQHGVLVRLDRKSGERVNIQPQPEPGEDPLRWNWDSPLIVSPHLHTRLYFAAQRLFRSDNRGDTWTPISPDLTRRIDRNTLKMMGRVWSVDAIAKNTSTSLYGAIIAVSESPMTEGLIYVGTDDGLIQVTEDGGANWRRVERFPGVPDTTMVSDVVASRHNDRTVYATFNNHKAGDFAPYVMKSTDRGQSWTSIAGNLPGRGSAWVVAEDHQDPNLLFVGTEFGVFVTTDGGAKWTQLKGGLPTIPVRDIAIHAGEDDLVLATFGRGFWVLDDYSPIRQLTAEVLAAEATLLPVPTAPMFIPTGLDAGGQGDGVFTAANPSAGATFTYHLKTALRSRADARRERERGAARRGEDTPYPEWEALRAEDSEEAPTIIVTVTDASGAVVRRLTGPVGAGLHRVSWDLRYPSSAPVTNAQGGGGGFGGGFGGGNTGPYAAPGQYTVSLAKRVDGVVTPLGNPQTFDAQPVVTGTLPATDRAALLAFQRKTADLQRAVMGAAALIGEVNGKLVVLKRAIEQAPAADQALREQARRMELKLGELEVMMSGDRTIERRSEPAGPGITDRVQSIVSGSWNYTGAPTSTHQRAYAIAAEAFAPALAQLRQLVETDMKSLEAAAEAAGVPWTAGRVPTWRP